MPDRGTGSVAGRVLSWFDRHGRHDLPWQRTPTPYRIWVSEIMLQQTQVQTVIPYFERFMARFPDLATLAFAPQDDVLAHWAGLGYYARARHLHRAAREMRERHGGALPTRIDSLMALPGIGRSTAGAILSLACGQAHAVLDGNVKRVLARYHGIDGWPGRSAVSRRLWGVAEANLPQHRPGDYNQAMMDLGATCCVRARPACGRCPLTADCTARSAGTPERFPGRRPARKTPLRQTRMLVISDADGAILLERRPPSGVWGGLWCLPELDAEQAPGDWCQAELGASAEDAGRLAPRRHQFTHFRLDIEPLLLRLRGPQRTVMDGAGRLWYKPGTRGAPGVPAPIKALLRELEEMNE